MRAAAFISWFVVISVTAAVASADSRLALSFGGSAETATGQSAMASSSASGFGAFAKVGAQLSDVIGIGVGASFGTIIFEECYRVPATVDFTPSDHWTIGVGPVIGGGFAPRLTGSGTSDAFTYVGGTAEVDYHFAVSKRADGARKAWTVGLALDLGTTLDVHNGDASGSGGAATGVLLEVGRSYY